LERRKRRLIFFVLMIAVGIAVGVAYGWMVNPVRYTDTGPQSLGEGFKTDYVLMVAEIYPAENDAVMAMARLSFLGADSLLQSLDEALTFAQENQYPSDDLQLMTDLRQAVATTLGETP
jgi:hypothetical protein